jgi:sensor c-di-GMP phosphodiesterase-like protein
MEPIYQKERANTPKEMNSSLAFALIVSTVFSITMCLLGWYQAHRIHVLERDLSVSIEMQKACLK